MNLLFSPYSLNIIVQDSNYYLLILKKITKVLFFSCPVQDSFMMKDFYPSFTSSFPFFIFLLFPLYLSISTSLLLLITFPPLWR